MNPHLRLRADSGAKPTRKARIFAVDENVDVAAKLALFVKHPIANARMLARERLDNFGRGHARVRRERQLNHIAAAGPSAQRRRNMHAHG